MELADVPLETRCQAAIAVIYTDVSLGVRKRRDLLAAALWPSQARTPPGPLMPPVDEQRVGEARDAAVAAYLAGEGSYTAVARRYGVNAATIKTRVQALRRHSWVGRPEPRPRPDLPPHHAEARRLHQQGATITELAARYEQPWPVVRGWVKGRG